MPSGARLGKICKLLLAKQSEAKKNCTISITRNQGFMAHLIDLLTLLKLESAPKNPLPKIRSRKSAPKNPLPKSMTVLPIHHKSMADLPIHHRSLTLGADFRERIGSGCGRGFLSL